MSDETRLTRRILSLASFLCISSSLDDAFRYDPRSFALVVQALGAFGGIYGPGSNVGGIGSIDACHGEYCAMAVPAALTR